jgi:2-dehydropantoate 2-reductase
MKITILGAGAVGGYLGLRMAEAGADVALVARGPHLAAIRARGLTLREQGTERTRRLRATDRPAELGVQDYVILALTGNQIDAALESVRPLLGPWTCVVSAANAIPYWYFHRHPGPWEGRRLATVDPTGRQWALLGPQRAIGCVVHAATELVAPGVIAHLDGDRFPLGEPSGEASLRVKGLSALFAAAGLKAPVLARIRDEIWHKLWGGPCDPLGALTGATLDVAALDQETGGLARAMRREAQAVAERLGVRVPVDLQRIDGAATLEPPGCSRAMEIEALVSVVQELGGLVGMPTPTLDLVLTLLNQRAARLGLDRRNKRLELVPVAA